MKLEISFQEERADRRKKRRQGRLKSDKGASEAITQTSMSSMKSSISLVMSVSVSAQKTGWMMYIKFINSGSKLLSTKSFIEAEHSRALCADEKGCDMRE